MKVAVYGGSFNPMHEGHLAVLRALSGMFGMTYLVVSPQNPFKGAQNIASARQRYEAAVRILARHPELSARAEDIELTMPSPQYSIRTLDALHAREPQNEFVLAMGADNLERFREWRDYRRILTEYGVVVFPRDGIDMEAWKSELLREVPGAGITLAQMPEVNISSSEIRSGAKADNTENI